MPHDVHLPPSASRQSHAIRLLGLCHAIAIALVLAASSLATPAVAQDGSVGPAGTATPTPDTVPDAATAPATTVQPTGAAAPAASPSPAAPVVPASPDASITPAAPDEPDAPMAVAPAATPPRKAAAPAAAGSTVVEGAVDAPPVQTEFSEPSVGGAPLSGPEVSAHELPEDLSPWGMFLAADWVVKAVMIGLAFASVVTWTVWLFKSLEITAAKAKARRGRSSIAAAATLHQASTSLGQRNDVAALMVRAAEDEWRLSHAATVHSGVEGIKQRVTSRLARLQAQSARRLMLGTGVLATIGSTAPFVGLFGTVWGIMNSFIGISESNTTNLAVVAPGIAEALLATALGLVAAIPAVVIYNVFARSIGSHRQLVADIASGVELLLSRDLDLRLAGTLHRQAAE